MENPHDFEPDLESCTPEEVIFWQEAKERWDQGERDVRGARCETVRDDEAKTIAHFTRTSWEIGVNYFEMDDEDDE